MESVKNPLIAWLSKIYNYCISHKKEAVIAGSILVAIIILVVGYVFYMSSLQKRAHRSFVDALKYFDSNIVEKQDAKEDFLNLDEFTFYNQESKWSKVAQVFQQGYEQNKGAGVAPMFLAYQSQALLNLGKQIEAINVLRQAVKLMPSSTLKTYYRVKLSLMQIDSENKDMVNDGVSILKEISLDQKNPTHDMVLYRLGEYYWYEKNFDEAKNYWNQLILKYGKSVEKPSAWVELARPKLKLISFR